jgi:hypothetical protein
VNVSLVVITTVAALPSIMFATEIVKLGSIFCSVGSIFFDSVNVVFLVLSLYIPVELNDAVAVYVYAFRSGIVLFP